jgi:hypothetical protein
MALTWEDFAFAAVFNCGFAAGAIVLFCFLRQLTPFQDFYNARRKLAIPFRYDTTNVSIHLLYCLDSGACTFLCIVSEWCSEATRQGWFPDRMSARFDRGGFCRLEQIYMFALTILRPSRSLFGERLQLLSVPSQAQKKRYPTQSRSKHPLHHAHDF